MRTLSYTKFSLAIRASHFSCMRPSIIVARYNNHKIFNSIILLVFSGTKRIFNSFMMHQFPLMQISFKMFSHDQTMFHNKISFICHGMEKIIIGKPHSNVPTRSKLPASLPPRIIRTLFSNRFITIRTASTPKTSRIAFSNRRPSLFPTIYTSKPLEYSSAILMFVFNVSYIWHKAILAQFYKVRKGGIVQLGY